MAVYLFYGFFVASKVGKTGLTPTVDVWGPGGAEVTAANATEIGDGLYSYSHTDAVDGDYTAVFKTADATVDAQHVPALAVKQISAYLDATITSRAATGADGDTLETLSDQLDGVEPVDVWGYATRTLTQSAAAVTAAVSGSNITCQRGDTLVAALTGLGNISTRTKLWLAIKGDLSYTDAQAVILCEETAGLTVVNGAAYTTTTDASIVVTNATTGALTITIKPAVTKELPVGSYHYDMQYLTAAGVVTTITAATFTVSADVTRAVS